MISIDKVIMYIRYRDKKKKVSITWLSPTTTCPHVPPPVPVSSYTAFVYLRYEFIDSTPNVNVSILNANPHIMHWNHVLKMIITKPNSTIFSNQTIKNTVFTVKTKAV